MAPRERALFAQGRYAQDKEEDLHDRDEVAPLQSWVDFPWMEDQEWAAYVAFARDKTGSSQHIVAGMLLIGAPYFALRTNLPGLGTPSFNHFWILSSLLSVFNVSNVLLHISELLIKEGKQNFLTDAVGPLLCLKGKVNLPDFLTVVGVALVGLGLLGRVANGACPPDATLWSSQGCNTAAASNSIPPESVALLYLNPLFCAVLMRGVSLQVLLGSYFLAMGFVAFALVQVDGLVLNAFSVVYGLGFMIAVFEVERLWRVSFRSMQARRDLLDRVFPTRISDALLAGKPVEPSDHDNVCVFFSDIVTFTELTQALGARSTLDMVDAIYRVMDDLVGQFPGKLWKMETAGDAYMVECGAVYPGKSLEENCATMLDFAILVQQRLSELVVCGFRDAIQLRIGVHCGPCTSGLVGSRKHMPHFSLFGDVINATSRVETTCSPGMIHVSDAVVQSIKAWKSPSRAKQYLDLLTLRGMVDLKGLGRMNTWWLTTPWNKTMLASRPSFAQLATLASTSSTEFDSALPFSSASSSSSSCSSSSPSLQSLGSKRYFGGGDVLSFGFDVRCVPTDVESLVEATYGIFARLFSLERLRVNPVTLKAFFRAVGFKYNNDVFYHNFHHAFSVTQFTAALYKQCVVDTTEIKTSLEMTMFASMIAVVCHDAGHDGFNNTFHVNSKSPLAKTYFNQSPLEHHHTSVALSCLGTHGCNVFENWSPAFVDFARNLISNSLLATDMLLHDQVLQDLLSYDPSLLTSSLYNFSSSGQVELAFHAEQYELLRLSRLMLHAADISNTVRPFAISAHYTDKLASEFGVQVAQEKELGLPVAPFMVIPDDQAMARGEIYFLTNIARPYFAALAKAFPACQELVSTLDGNIKEWALVAI